MTELDARGRIKAGDIRYGLICECGNLKNYQSRTCWDCYCENVRKEVRYWERRTCPDCGGPKKDESVRCRTCANKRLRGNTWGGRAQPPDHPWRAA